MAIKIKLKAIFADRNIKSGAFAEAHGIGATTMSHLINNKGVAIRFDVLDKICKALDLSVADVMEVVPD